MKSNPRITFPGKKLLLFFFLGSIIVTGIVSLRSVLSGSTPFWFDPARDFLLASQNSKKFSLIGPPTGIPGIFYGPYWIWAISAAMKVSLDPRIVTLLVLTIPYFLFFPLILIRFSKWIGVGASFLIWLYFILAYERYTTFLWNPHLTPLFFLLLAFFVITSRSEFEAKKEIWKIFLAGLCSGFILNIHLSFGLGVFLSTLIFLGIESISSLMKSKKSTRRILWKKRAVVFLTFCAGVFLTYLPILTFEFRHGFTQTKAFWQTFTQAALYNSASVGQTGLTKLQILHYFLMIPASFLRLGIESTLGLFAVGFMYFFSQRNVKGENQNLYGRAFGFLLLTATVTLALYETSKNPVWQYHFVGFEVIFLLFLVVLFRGSKMFIRGGLIWGSILVILYMVSYTKTFSVDPLTISSLSTKQNIVEKILEDGQKPFTVFVYSPAIYTYDYDYLFEWLGRGNYRKDVSQEKISLIYLIIPETSQPIRDDFIEYKTPKNRFITVTTWKFPDRTEVIKREENKSTVKDQ